MNSVEFYNYLLDQLNNNKSEFQFVVQYIDGSDALRIIVRSIEDGGPIFDAQITGNAPAIQE